MESELIRLMQDGMAKDNYDDDWYEQFFEIYESSVPLTPEEREVFVRFLAHGYLKEWETDYVECATCHVEPNFDLWIKVFKQLPKGSLGGFFFYQLLDSYRDSKFDLPSDIRWYKALLEYPDEYGDEPEEVLYLFETAFDSHKDPKFRDAIIRVAKSWVDDYGLDISDYYDRLEEEDYSDNFNNSTKANDEFARALIEAENEIDPIDLYVDNEPHVVAAPNRPEQPVMTETTTKKSSSKITKALKYLIGIILLAIVLIVACAASYEIVVKGRGIREVLSFSALKSLRSLFAITFIYLIWIGAFQYLYRFFNKKMVVYSSALFNAVLFPMKGILGRNLHLYGNGPENVRFNHLNDSPAGRYPIMLVPKMGTDIAMPVLGKNCKRGPGEQWLAMWIKAHGLKNFYDNQALRAGGHRYEPDLAYIDEQRGIYIDIENDEPYTLGKRIPTHYLGKDDQRNNDVTAAGWIVLRFSEKQCIDSPASVARTIMDVVRSIAPEVEMPRVLQTVQPVDTDQRWDYDTARQHAKSRYRDSYMNKHFILRLGNLFFK